MEQIKNLLWLWKNNLFPAERNERAILALCVGVAFLFWIVVRLSQTYPSEKKVRIVYEGLPQSKTFASAPIRSIEVGIEATGWDLLYESIMQPNPVLTFKPNDGVIQINENRLTKALKAAFYSDDIEVKSTSIDEINLDLENRLEKKVPILLKYKVQYKTGHALRGPVAISPDSVWIQGPASLVQHITQWPTRMLSLTDLKSSLVQSLPLKTINGACSLSQRAVEVSIPVEQVTEKVLFVPVTVVGSRKAKVFPPTVRLTCNVGLSRFEKIRSSDFLLEVDVDLLNPDGDNQAAVNLKAQPGYIDNIRLEPKIVECFWLKAGKQ
jgi:hypothetical protein